MNIVQVIVGLAALLFGRKLFWLFVGVVGFATGIDLATLFLNNLPQWAIFLVAFAAGLVGALLALFFQRLAIIAAGFLGGGSLLLDAINLSGWQAAPVSWLIFLIGGFVGALLLYFLFDWTLIFLSSLIGADLIRQGIPVSPSMTAVVFFGLFIAGFIVQAKMMGPRNRK